MRALIIQNCALEGLGLYESYLAEHAEACDIVHAFEEQPPPLDAYDVVVVGGTPDPVYHRSRYAYLSAVYELLKAAVRSDQPCLGVCGGAQLVAAALGAEVRPNPEKEIGFYQLSLTEDGGADSLLRGFPEHFEAFQWHGDTFAIPKGGRRLVEGEKCRNQMFRCGNVVGVQFHLEISREDAVRWAAEYADELTEFGKTADEIAGEFAGREAKVRELAVLLVENYIATLHGEQ